MRPTYETEIDRDNEQIVFKWVGAEYGCTLIKLKNFMCTQYINLIYKFTISTTN